MSSTQRIPGNFLAALKAIAASDPRSQTDEFTRRRSLTYRMKASDAADLAAREVPCNCGWDESGPDDHAPECKKNIAWVRAYDLRLDELEEGRGEP